MSFVCYTLSKSERSNLDRYLKNLAIKTTQVICQARFGEKVHSVCEPNPAMRNYWFNIAITDQPEVTSLTRRALGLKESRDDRSIVANLPLCVEITLKTEEGYDMLLEVWSLSIIPELNSPAIRELNTVYSSFGILLKSIIAVSRATPAYKLSRRTSETYRITHSISAGKPADLNRLGEDYKQFRIGQTCTVFGTVNMSVAYRTKMTISPTPNAGRDAKIMLKSDHFLNDFSDDETLSNSPTSNQHHHNNRHYYGNTRNNDKLIIDLDKPLRPGAFVDLTQLRHYTEEDHILPETPPFSWLLKKTQEDNSSADDVFVDETPAVRSPAAVRTKPIDVRPPAVQRTTSGGSTTTSVGPNNTATVLSSPRSLDERGRLSQMLLNDDDPLLFKELLLPFATETTPLNELAKFFRDLNNLPPISLEQSQHASSAGRSRESSATRSGEITANLTLDNNYPLYEDVFEDDEDAERGAPDAAGTLDTVEVDAVDELTRQLAHFETSLNDYDTLITSLCSRSEIEGNPNE